MTMSFKHSIDTRPWQAVDRVLKRFLNDNVSPALFPIVLSAFEHGAYVAGGFAEVVMKHFIGDIHDEQLELDVATYLDVTRRIDRSKGWWRARRGDIDLFFQGETDMSTFLERVTSNDQLSDRCMGDTPTHAAVEFDCGSVLVQAVKCNVGPIDQVLGGFDIHNAMVAFNDKETVSAQGWDDITRLKVLHVANWTSPFVISRLTKWLHKHKLTALSPKTALEIVPQSLALIDRLQKHPLPQMTPGTDSITPSLVTSHLRMLLPHLSNSDLLVVSSLYSEETNNYGDAFPNPLKLLSKRGGIVF